MGHSCLLKGYRTHHQHDFTAGERAAWRTSTRRGIKTRVPFFEPGRITNGNSWQRAGQSGLLTNEEGHADDICSHLFGLWHVGRVSAVAWAGEDSDADRSHPTAFVKDSAITANIKTKLAAEHITSLGRIHVDTDKNGAVWLSGTARSQAAIDKAVSIARDTEHVVSVHSDIKIKSDD